MKRRISPLTLTAVCLCAVLTIGAVGFLLFHLNVSADKAVRADTGRVSIDTLETRTDAALAELLQPGDTAAPASAAAAPEPVQIQPIPDEVLIAPAPDKGNYDSGQAWTAAEVVEAAKAVLPVDNMYFREDSPVAPDTLVSWYFDDSILALCWSEIIDNTVYTFSEVVVADPSQFRRFMTGGSFGSGQLALVTEMSETVNAVVAASGDFYAYRGSVVSVQNGEVMRANSGWLDVCMIDYDGNFHMIPRAEINGRKDLAAYIENYVQENNIRFCLEFGPILYDHGKSEIEWGYPAGACGKGRDRSAICQLGPGHYMVVDANTHGIYTHEPNIYEFQEVVGRTGCISAFALDGGQTAAVAMNNKLMNTNTYGNPRQISDIIYFATAIPSGE